jgi:hypothetical protein
MTKLRLPNGGGVDTDAISQWGELNEQSHVWNEKTLYVDPGVTLDVVLYGHIKATYNNADARALYAWLSANAVAIGEDVGEPAIKESDTAARRSVYLNALADNNADAQYSASAERVYGISASELVLMANAGLIKSGREHWELTMHGFATIRRDEDITQS